MCSKRGLVSLYTLLQWDPPVHRDTDICFAVVYKFGESHFDILVIEIASVVQSVSTLQRFKNVKEHSVRVFTQCRFFA